MKIYGYAWNGRLYPTLKSLPKSCKVIYKEGTDEILYRRVNGKLKQYCDKKKTKTK